MFTPFALEDFFNKTENSYDLSFSSAAMPALSLKELEQFLDKEISTEIFSLALDYGSALGKAELREKLATINYSDCCLSPDKFLLSAGAAEAINIVFSTLFEAGDEIIVQSPIYNSLFQLAKDRGVKIIHWHCSAELEQNMEQLQALITSNKNIKAVVLNNPNNPLGIAFNQQQLQKIALILGELPSEPYLIADEVFLDISTSLFSLAHIDYPSKIVISDLSKVYGCPGLRLGWIACNNQELQDKFLAYRNYLSLRPSVLSELVASFVLDARNAILQTMRSLYEQNKASFFELNQQAKNQAQAYFETFLPIEEIYGLTTLAKFTADGTELLNELKKQRILLLAAGFYAPEFEDYYRIGFCLKQPGLFKELLASQELGMIN